MKNQPLETPPAGQDTVQVSAAPSLSVNSTRATGHLLSLEQRMLFDGAAMASVDAQLIDSDSDGGTAIQDSSGEPVTGEISAATGKREVLLIDSSVQHWADIAMHAAPGLEIVVLNDQEHGLDQLLRAVQGSEPVAAIHIVSHGVDGRIALGSDVLDASVVDASGGQLAELGARLTGNADILLYGCDVAASETGLVFMQALADATGADVNASDDLTGHADLGGNWQLEVSTGSIEAELALSQAGIEGWHHLLNPVPAVSLTAPSSAVMIGGDFTVQAVFDNTALVDPGYAPYIDLFVPVQGADGGASPDGLTISGATYLGASLTQTEITLTSTDISNGFLNHPYFVDNAGNTTVTIPAGMTAGDKLIVFELPFGSYTAGQPASQIEISGSVSALADLNTNLNLIARAGFRYGNDALDNPATDPSIQGAETTVAISPSLYQIRTTYIGPENETASGPNYLRAYRIDVDIADGQQLSSLNLASILPDGMTYQAISGTPGTIGSQSIGLPDSGSWINVNGVLVSSAATEPASPGPGRNPIVRDFGTVTGTASSADVSMVVQFYVPEFYDDGITPVLDPVTGDSVLLTHGTSLSASWDPFDGRDGVVAVSEMINNSHQLEVEALALQKGRTIDGNVGVAGISPGDRLRYSLNLQVSDYFAVGGNSSASGSTDQLLVTDTLSDGLTLLDTTTSPSSVDPSLVVTRSGGAIDSYALIRGVNYTVTQLAGGQEQIVFDLRSTVATGNGQILIGDLFDADNTQIGATTAVLQFDAQVLETYRVAPPDAAGNPQAGSAQGNLNEADYVVNNAVISSTVLDAGLNPDAASLQSEGDDTRVTDQIEANSVGIAIVGRNGLAVTNNPSSPISIAPGDEVTYRVTYTVPTGDFEDFALDAYLPLPIFDVADPDSDGTPSGWSAAGAFTTAPTVGEYAVRATGGDGLGVAVPVPTVLSANGLSFDFGNREDLSNNALDIEVFFTVRASDDPFADGLFLSALAQQSGTSTGNAPLATQSIDRLELTEPDVDIVKGVVQDDVATASSTYDPAYAGAAPESLFNPAGDNSANPLTGVIAAGAVANIDANISQVDAGDKLRFAIAITNNGSSAAGAFDVRFQDTLPANIDAASVENLRIVYGDGTVLNPVTDLRVVGGGAITSEADAIAALFGAGLELIDPEESTPGAGAALAGTLDVAGNPVAAGSNVLIVTYDATVVADALADNTETANASLINYAGSEAGPDHTAQDKTDAASVTTPLPQIDKQVVGTDQPHTTDNNGAAAGLGDVLVGEVITYQVVVQVPEGRIDNAIFVDVLDSNRLAFANLVSATPSAGVSFDSGEVFVTQVPTDSGGPSNRLDFNLGTITNANVDNATTDTITFTYTAVVLNTAATNANVLVNNSARLQHAGTDVSDSAPNMRVVEPAVDVQITSSAASVDAGDTVTYTVTVTSTGPVSAFEVDLSHAIPSGMTYVPGSLTSVSGGGSPVEAGGTITANWSDIANGGSAQFTYQAQVDAGVSVGDTLSSPVDVVWSSLPGSGNDDHSVFVATAEDTERTGAGGVNDYADAATAPVTVTVMTPVMTLVDTSEASSAGATVVPGEVVRYRMVSQVPEALAADFQMRPSLPNGLRFVNDGSVTIGFVANDGVTGIDSSTISGASLDITGGGNVAADITGLTPVLSLPGSAITDGAGAALAPNTVLGSGADPVFRLGDLINSDRDGDREFVVIEFNAVVENESANISGQTLPATFDVQTGGVGRGSSAAQTVTLGEPSITDVDKQVVDVSGDQVTFEVTWTNSGNQPAHDVRLTDSFVGAVNLSFNQAVTLTSVPSGTVDNSTATGLDVSVPVLAPGGSVTVRYTGTITDVTAVVPARDATVQYTSLSATGDSLVVATEDIVGTAVPVTTSSTGERTGNTADYGGVVNNYADTDAAALGVISGRLWDDTLNYQANYDSGTENPLAGVLVTMRDAGVNGTFGDGDDLVQTTTTDADGRYFFTAAHAGNYRIDVPTSLTDATSGPVTLYFERTATGAVDGRSEFAVLEGENSNNHDFGFVKQNAQPTVAAPASLSVNEDEPLVFTGASLIQIGDPDLLEGANPAVPPSNFRTVLSVGQGVLSITPAAGVTISNNNSASVTLVGSVADINASLDGMTYQGSLNFNGADTLSITVDDRGNLGDADGDGVPGETADDNLTASASVSLSILPMPDDPVANPDARTVDEDSIATGQSLAPNATQIAGGDQIDTDPDTGNGDTLTVAGVQASVVPGPVSGSVGTPVNGVYGELQIDANGQWTYTPGAAAQALTQGQTVNDVFTYTIEDSTGRTDTTTVTLTLTGVNDAPVSVDDSRSLTEDDPPIAGNVIGGNGVAGGQPGDLADTDPDGEPLTVGGVQFGSIAGPLTGGLATALPGTYGSLTMQADGSYTYSTNAFAQTLQSGQTVTDMFTYTVVDPQGAVSTSRITIQITGENDNITAFPDLRQINEPVDPLNPVPLAGNVIAAGGTGDQADIDIDNDPLNIQGVQTGSAAGPLTGGVGNALVGTWGTLVLQGDGSYVYTPGAQTDSLAAGQIVDDVFTYTVADGTGSATTTLTIRLTGSNDAPVANPDTNTAPGDASASATGNAITASAPGDLADTDVDTNDGLTIVGVVAGNNPGPHNGSVAAPLIGSYGTLTLAANGDYVYTADNTNAAVLALRSGQSLTDVFSYTVDDGNGGQAGTTISITVTGVENPPTSLDRGFTISEDLTTENGVPLTFTPGDFAFADPDAGASLANVRLDSLPASGELRLNGAPVSVGQLIGPAQLGQLTYEPAKHANNLNLGGPVTFSFTVIDDTGLNAVSANLMTIDITPVNDPPVALEITRLIDAEARSGSELARIPDIPVPSDLDRPAQVLTTTVTGIPPAENGRFELDGVLVTTGQVLTDAQLQRLHFVPAPTLATTPDSQGNQPAGSLTYQVVDDQGGSATGAIHINVRPNNAILPPSVGLTGSRGIGETNSFGEPVSPVVGGQRAGEAPPAIDPITEVELKNLMFTTGEPPEPKGEYTTNHAVRFGVRNEPGVYLEPEEFEWGQVHEDDFDMMSMLARVQPYETLQDQIDRKAREMAVKAAAEAAVDDGCEPEKPKPKPKPKVVKRSVLGEMAGDKPKRFSEAIKSERIKVKPRLKVKPTAAPIC